MAFCGTKFSNEAKEEEKVVDHSLKDVYAFSTKKKQAASVSAVSAEGLLTMGKNKVPVDRRMEVCYNDAKFNFLSYRSLCQLRMEMPRGKRCVGSCVQMKLKDTYNVLTCAHNMAGISSRDNILVKYKEGYVYHARQGVNTWKSLLKLDEKKIRVHPLFDGQPDSGFDIGVCPITKLESNKNDIYLKKPERDVCWESAKPEDLKKGMKIELSGYPGEKNGQPYTHTGEIADVTKTKQGGYLLWYTADASPGNSGSPIRIVDEQYIKSKNRSSRKFTIGIHTGHDEIAGLNFGTLLTPAIEKWMENEPDDKENWGHRQEDL